MYYSYLDDFHVEPKDWADLFERGSYKEVNSLIQKAVESFYSKE